MPNALSAAATGLLSRCATPTTPAALGKIPASPQAAVAPRHALHAEPLRSKGPGTSPAHPFALIFTFDELRLYPASCALASGAADIGFDREGAWAVNIIVLDADKAGARPLTLPSEHPLHRVVRDALQLHCADHIAEAIGEDLREHGYGGRGNDEHRLDAVHLGVGRAA